MVRVRLRALRCSGPPQQGQRFKRWVSRLSIRAGGEVSQSDIVEPPRGLNGYFFVSNNLTFVRIENRFSAALCCGLLYARWDAPKFVPRALTFKGTVRRWAQMDTQTH